MNRIRLMRYERGLSAKDVVEGSGISHMTLARLESGDTQPSAPIAKALADFYEVSVAELLGIDHGAAA